MVDYQSVVDIVNSLITPTLVQVGEMRQSITQLNHDYTSLSNDMASVKANVDWLMKFCWVLITAVIGNLVASIFYIVIHFRKKNNNNKQNEC